MGFLLLSFFPIHVILFNFDNLIVTMEWRKEMIWILDIFIENNKKILINWVTKLLTGI